MQQEDDIICTETYIKQYVDVTQGKRDVGWDVIAIGASNEAQAIGYKILAEKKFGNRVRVYADTPGKKIGNGGCLLLTLDHLHKEFGELLFSKKVLFIPAGGFSQRMPWVSCLGKLFALVGCSFGLFDMLDLTVAFSLPFFDVCPKGTVFLCAPDVLIPFQMRRDKLCSGKDVTALAHLTSDLELGTAHGVYVVDGSGDVQRVLQKPNMQLILESGAILNDASLSTVGGVLGQPQILIDSDFWIGHHITRLLLKWLHEEALLRWELDAYGDMLRALGPEAVLDYADNSSNLSCNELVNIEELKQDRISLFSTFQRNNSHLQLCVLPNSKFIHIGSTKEYLHHLFHSSSMGKCLSPDCQGLFFIQSSMNSHKVCVDNAVIMRSRLDVTKEVSIGTGSVLEYCSVESADVFRIGSGCVLSNCRFLGGLALNSDHSSESSRDSVIIEVPSGIILQTVPLLFGDFVTWHFQSSDNTKKTAKVAAFSTLQFMGRSLEAYLTHHNIHLTTNDDTLHSIWTLPLFLTAKSPELSMVATLSAISGKLRISDYLEQQSGGDNIRLVSMAEILKNNDVNKLLAMRAELE